ncbi:hypothetical protein T439DRAFT_328300 [Meredithblackwellia eburnea MCA 4105]
MEASPSTGTVSNGHSTAHGFPPRTTIDTNNPSQTTTTTSNTITDGLSVRLSLATRLLLSLHDMSGARRRNLLVLAFFSLAQIVVFIVILALSASRHESCDKGSMLRVCLILTIVRLAWSLPLNAYTAIVPQAMRRTSSAEARQALEARRVVGSPSLDIRIRKLYDLASAFAFGVFITLNIVTLSPSTCKAQAPLLYNASLTALVFSYIYAAEMIFLCIAVIFFLPLALIGIRLFGWGEKSPDVGPLKETDINQIPLRVFLGIKADPSAPAAKPSESDDIEAQKEPSALSPQPTTTSSPSQTKVTRFSRLWRSRKSSSSGSSKGKGSKSNLASEPGKDGAPERRKLDDGLEYIELTESQATCAICLMDYDPPPPLGEGEPWAPDPLRCLPCQHTFHQACADSWLVVSGRCPVCNQPVVGRKGKQSTSSSTSEQGPAQGA